MTNHSYTFVYGEKKYILRIPGEGTDKFINRKNEAINYQTIAPYGLCDQPVYINPDNGIKITEFISNAKVCNPDDWSEVAECIAITKKLHSLKLRVEHEFNLLGQIDFYEELRGVDHSEYPDYKQTKANIMYLADYVANQPKEYVLSHIDAVADNFIYDSNGRIQLTDWEYAGMQDPDVDIAMFGIYSGYSKKQMDKLIDIYLEGQPDQHKRAKVYSYVAMCGLLWSNWCEYKKQLGVDFGEYAESQYKYAKDYYVIAKALIDELRD